MLSRIIRVLCYGALGIFAASMGLIALLSLTGLCDRIDEGAVSCGSAVPQVLAQLATAYILLSVFTLVPALLALGGIAFGIFDGVRALRRR